MTVAVHLLESFSRVHLGLRSKCSGLAMHFQQLTWKWEKRTLTYSLDWCSYSRHPWFMFPVLVLPDWNTASWSTSLVYLYPSYWTGFLDMAGKKEVEGKNIKNIYCGPCQHSYKLLEYFPELAFWAASGKPLLLQQKILRYWTKKNPSKTTNKFFDTGTKSVYSCEATKTILSCLTEET